MAEREDLIGDPSTASSGTFSAYAGSLSPNTTYYYRAYVREWNAVTNDWEFRWGAIRSFTTLSEGQTPEAKPGYLSCGEIPTVNLSGSTAHGNETFPYRTDFNTEAEYKANVSDWYRYGVSGNSGHMVVTHTFIRNNKQYRNYSMLYDKSKKAALWVAFAMNADAYPWLVDRSDKWVYDPALVFGSDYSWQPDLTTAYAESSTYSRGHQVASNDRRTTSPSDPADDLFLEHDASTERFQWRGVVFTGKRYSEHRKRHERERYALCGDWPYLRKWLWYDNG